MKCRLFNKIVGIFFLSNLLLSVNVFSMGLFSRFMGNAFNKFKIGICRSIEDSVQSGGLFRDQNDYRQQDYQNTISEGFDRFFDNAGDGFFSKIRGKSYEHDGTVPGGLLKSITSGRTRTQNSLRTFFGSEENSKTLRKALLNKLKKIKRMSWKERFKLAAKWGIPYAVIAAGLLGSFNALRLYRSTGDREGLKAFARLSIPSITTGWYLATRGLRNGFKRSLLVNGVILGGSILFKTFKGRILSGF